MSRLRTLYRCLMGKMAVVSITGVVLFGFVFLHMIGNLKTFLGTDAQGVPEVDVYARFLRTMGEPLLPYGIALWIVRIVVGTAAMVHVVTVIDLARRNRAARPIRYRHRFDYWEATIAARTMLASGLFILVFVVIHLLQFTTATIQITPIVPGKIYANIHNAFSAWFVALFYVVAMALLGLHLFHGAWSLFQTLGVDNPDRNRGLRLLAVVTAVVLFLGFASVPIFVYSGVLRSPPAAAEAATAAVSPAEGGP